MFPPVFLNRFVRKMSPKAIADPKVKTPGLFRSTGLARTPFSNISSVILSISHFFERTLNMTSDSDEIDREDTFIRNVLIARKKYLVSISRIEESGSFILLNKQDLKSTIFIYVYQTDDTYTR